MKYIKGGPFADGAPVYAEAGWTGVIPAKGKVVQLQGVTGGSGRQTRPDEYLSWAEASTGSYYRQNLALRLSGALVGLDVDAYDGKPGAASLAALEAAHGALPATYSSTSRGPGPSRIFFYRLPAGTGRLNTLPGPGIETIQHHHRYAVVWPSRHPGTQETYRWYGPDGERLEDGVVPSPDDFPELPAGWVAALSSDHLPALTGTVVPVLDGEPLDVRAMLTPGAVTDGQDNKLTALAWHLYHSDLPRSTCVDVLEGVVAAFVDNPAAGKAPWKPGDGLAKWEYLEAKGEPRGEVVAEDSDAFEKLVAQRVQKIRVEQEARHRLVLEREQGTAEKSVAEALEAVLAGNWRVYPSVGTVADDPNGHGLFYPGRVNGIFGDGSAGKTLYITQLQAEVLNAGGIVVHWDFDHNAIEDQIQKLVWAGAKPEAILERFHSTRTAADLERMPSETVKAVDLVTMDALSPAIAGIGMKVNDSEGVDEVFRIYFTPFTRHGAAGVFIDHIGHENTERQAGSKRKFLATQGALYEIKLAKRPEFFGTGQSTLTLRKDNGSGAGKRNEVVAYVNYRSTGEGPIETTVTRASLPGFGLKQATGQTERMIIELLQKEPGPWSKTQLAKALQKKPETVRAAVRNLLSSGELAELEDVPQNKPNLVLADGPLMLPEGA
ncbi:bifunctional DNA primase/polymerase [Streptomyces sp. NPDC005438]|uniref:bifunctional DNA primase/polymerase n=1 Tax=Streptomyces sp. NPDC005438 TaxID=3156880 RepID=UPI0033AF10B6